MPRPPVSAWSRSRATFSHVFFDAGKALVAALDKHERERDPSELLDGTDSEVARRWACSAVQL